jgi:signal transduction histidine kinase
MRRARVRVEVSAVGGDDRERVGVISRAASVSPPSGSLVRDPVLVLPVAVVAGLALGWEGLRTGVPGSVIAVDLALSWGLVAASVLVSQRARWRRPGFLLALAGMLLLAEDLQWSSASGLWTAGLVLQLVWLAVIVQLVLTFPAGRPWSGLALVTILLGYLAAPVGGLASALVTVDSRDALSILSNQNATDTIGRIRSGLGFAVLLSTVGLVVWRLVWLRGASRRAQAPLLIGAALAFPATMVWLARQALSSEPRSPVIAAPSALIGLIPLGFVAAIGWSRLRRRQASDLVVELRTADEIALRDRLARALGDTTLQLAYRLDDGRYVDDSGQPAAVPDRPGRAVTLLSAGDTVLAALVHDPVLLDEPGLVESVRATAGLVLENERLAAEVRAQLAEVRASRARLVTAGDEERRRIERDLHDGAQQRLVAVCVTLGMAAGRADPALAETLRRAQDDLEEALAELRALARGIHPTLLHEEGLDAALEALARRTPLPVEIEGSVGCRVAPAIELAAYFVATEALTNTVKHGRASRADVCAALHAGTLTVSVSDDGVGGARLAPAGGLAGLRDRVEALDGTLSVESDPAGGTTVIAELPCES